MVALCLALSHKESLQMWQWLNQRLSLPLKRACGLHACACINPKVSCMYMGYAHA